MGSFGDLAASALVNSFAEPVSHIRLCFFIAAVVYVAAVTVLLVMGKETRMQSGDPRCAQANEQSLNIFAYLRALPPWMWKIGATYALGFFTLFCVMPNTSSWLGSSVLRGKLHPFTRIAYLLSPVAIW